MRAPIECLVCKALEDCSEGIGEGEAEEDISKKLESLESDSDSKYESILMNTEEKSKVHSQYCILIGAQFA
jgi:hypothetical protein